MNWGKFLLTSLTSLAFKGRVRNMIFVERRVGAAFSRLLLEVNTFWRTWSSPHSAVLRGTDSSCSHTARRDMGGSVRPWMEDGWGELDSQIRCETLVCVLVLAAGVS